MSNEASLTSPPTTSPWLLLWFRPRAAIRKALSREGEGTALAIFALGGVATIGMQRYGALWQLFVPPVADALFAGMFFAFFAALGAVGLYVHGYIFTSIARLFGGVGTQKATRAALAWSAPPFLLGALILSTGLASASTIASAPYIAFAIVVLFLVAWIWQFVLMILMLAETHGLSRWRASATAILGGIANLTLALALALVIRTLLFQPFYTPSGAMIPTLLVGDNFFVSKYAYGYSRYSIIFSPNLFSGRLLGAEPKRGDVVVFKLPRDNDTDYVKRVIGLPGDRIQMIEGRLYINNAIVPREPITPEAQVEDRNGKLFKAPTYKETLPEGVAHRIIEIQGDHGIYDNTELFVVPPDHFFVMGDNRDNSSDSRIPPKFGGVGYVPVENLVGRVVLIFVRQAEGAPEGTTRLHFEWVDAGRGTVSTP